MAGEPLKEAGTKSEVKSLMSKKHPSVSAPTHSLRTSLGQICEVAGGRGQWLQE